MRRITLLLISLLLVLSVCPTVAHAQTGLTVLESRADVEFPLRMDFSLSAESSANIVDVRLRYSVEQESYADVTSEAYVALAPAAHIDVSWALDMRRVGGLPPGTIVRYWWVVRDAAGSSLVTDPVRVEFEDNRYSWKTLNEGLVTVFWYSGDQDFATEVMSTAQESLTRLASDTGAQLKKPLKIYVYGSTQDLLEALIFPYEWTGAVTYVQYGVIAVGLPPQNLSWGKSAVAHELSHMAVHQVTANPYSGLPTWLDEGLAVYSEGLLDVSFSSALAKAVESDKLISVRSLASPFSALSDLAVLSYAESFSIVSFLIATYGNEKMLDLLTVFSRGNTYDGALKAVYGFDMSGLNMLWHDYVMKQFQPNRTVVGLVGVATG
jgi:hypothetical protein